MHLYKILYFNFLKFRTSHFRKPLVICASDIRVQFDMGSGSGESQPLDPRPPSVRATRRFGVNFATREATLAKIFAVCQV